MIRPLFAVVALVLLGLGAHRLGAVSARLDAVDARLATNQTLLIGARDAADRATSEASRARVAVDRHLAGAPLVAQLADDIESLREEVFALGGGR